MYWVPQNYGGGSWLAPVIIVGSLFLFWLIMERP